MSKRIFRLRFLPGSRNKVADWEHKCFCSHFGDIGECNGLIQKGDSVGKLQYNNRQPILSKEAWKEGYWCKTECIDRIWKQEQMRVYPWRYK